MKILIMNLRIAIVDDESGVRKSIQNMLNLHCKNPIRMYEAGSIEEAQQVLLNHSIDLLFLDVELEDGTGFDLLDLVSPVNFSVVFITAHDEFAIRAFRYHAIDYLLKPIDPEELMSAVNRACEHYNPTIMQMQVANLLNSTSKKLFDRITLQTKAGLVFIHADDISRIESLGNFSFVFLSNGERHLVSLNLKAFEEMLPNTRFYRPHQSHIVNKAFVQKFLLENGGFAIMQDGTEIPVARRKKHDFWIALRD
jgi:two-component system LytT family response regulator